MLIFRGVYHQQLVDTWVKIWGWPPFFIHFYKSLGKWQNCGFGGVKVGFHKKRRKTYICRNASGETTATPWGMTRERSSSISFSPEQESCDNLLSKYINEARLYGLLAWLSRSSPSMMRFAANIHPRATT